MKKLATLTALATTLFVGCAALPVEKTTDTKGSTIKVTPVNNVGYNFDITHKACTKDSHEVTASAAATMRVSDTFITQWKAYKLATLYRDTMARTIENTLSGIYRMYNSDEINQALSEGKELPVPESHSRLVEKDIAGGLSAFEQGVESIVDSGQISLRYTTQVSKTASPLCK